MPACLACLSAETRAPSFVVCLPCFHEHKDLWNEIQGTPVSREELRRKIWGQNFDKNRTPKNRARIAMAAYFLAQSGDDELLAEIRIEFPKQRAIQIPSPVEEEEPESPLATEMRDVNELERLLGRPDRRGIQSAGRFRTMDGHWVRSKSELLIANFLFHNRIPYQYERRVTVGGEDVVPDFFLPDAGSEGKGLYLEHFGMLDKVEYFECATKKARLFRRAGLELIATDEKDVLDFESALQSKLAPHISVHR